MEEAINFLKGFHFTNAIWVLTIPVILMTLDVLTGYLNAWVKSEVRSCRMREGLVKKFGEIVILVIGKLFVRIRSRSAHIYNESHIFVCGTHGAGKYNGES